MPQLIELIRANGLGGDPALQVFDVPLAGSQSGHACPGERDLGGRGEKQHLVFCPMLEAFRVQVQQRVGGICQIVDAVSIVPHDAEILGSGLQSCKAPDSFIGIGDAGGVGILGHTPAALNGFVVSHQAFDQIHVGPCLQHRHGDHFKAEVLRHGKMPVIARSRAQEFELFLLAPGDTAAVPVGISLGDAVKHHLQAGVVPQDNLVRRDFHHLAEDGAHLRQAVPHAVVPAVVALGIGKLTAGVKGFQHSQGQVQLFRAGLPSGHVQVQIQAFKVIVLLLGLLVDLPQFLSCFCRQLHHNISHM